MVRFYLPDIEERVASFLKELLIKMDISYKEIKTHKEGKSIYLEIIKRRRIRQTYRKKRKDAGMQYLPNKVFEENSAIDHIYLDVDGYRQDNKAQFRPFLSIFQKVRSEGKPYTLEPLNASERRIIHKYRKTKDLSTLQLSVKELKRVMVIFPAH